MKQPECPPNSFFEEWKPDIVPQQFKDQAEAEKWIRTKLDEDPIKIEEVQ